MSIIRRHLLSSSLAAVAVGMTLLDSKHAAASAPGTDRALLATGPWAEASRRAGGIDPWLLYAIALYETADSAGPGTIRPYPWALCFSGRNVRCGSRAEAAAHLADVTDTTNVDIGLMQVNWAAHHDRVASPSALLDPVRNLFVGADILCAALASAGLDLVLGVGRYHSWDEARARAYGLGVFALYLRLQHHLTLGPS